jgi:outer membrane protein assembly factor BamB
MTTRFSARFRAGLPAIAAGVCLILLAACATAQPASPPSPHDWNQFLGQDRNGIARGAKGLLDAWPEDGPKEVWRVAGGVGMSGIATAGAKLCTLVQNEGQQWLICLDSRTGQRVWQTALASEYKNPQGDGPRATPTIRDQSVFAFTGQGILSEVNLEDGKVIWSHDVVREAGGKVADYGMASSPLVVGDLVMVIAGAPKSCVVAYRVKSGEKVWAAGDDATGYSSPVVLEVGGKRQIVVFTGSSAIGLTPETGKLLWRYPYETDYDCNIAVPVAVDGNVLISSGENHGSVLLKLVPQGEQFTVEEIWKSNGTTSVLRSEWQTPILLNGHLYGLDNIGSAGPVTHLACIKAATGERVWQQPRFGKSNLIAADGKLLFSTMAGEVVMVRASPEGFQELGRKQVLGATRQAPALAGDRLFLRDDKEIVCLEVKAPQ